MGKKIFISYKYSDGLVRRLERSYLFTTARHYVDELQDKLEEGDHINKGENDNESMATLADSTIGSKLGDKIFDSTVTIVLISKGMKNNRISERDQWIPWEISYSLKVQSRQNQNSKTNAVLAVVIPDVEGSYNYFIEENTCPICNCRTLKTDYLFQILRDNMFNILPSKAQKSNCNNHSNESQPYLGNPSYIYSVKWDDFIVDINKYINIALEIRRNIGDYDVCKTIK